MCFLSSESLQYKTYVFHLPRRFLFSCPFPIEAHVHANELLIDAGRKIAVFFRDMLELGNDSSREL